MSNIEIIVNKYFEENKHLWQLSNGSLNCYKTYFRKAVSNFLNNFVDKDLGKNCTFSDYFLSLSKNNKSTFLNVCCNYLISENLKLVNKKFKLKNCVSCFKYLYVINSEVNCYKKIIKIDQSDEANTLNNFAIANSYNTEIIDKKSNNLQSCG